MQPHGIGAFLLDNAGKIIGFFVWVFTVAIGLIRQGWVQVDHERRLKVLEDVFARHLANDNGLHRTPDFERRFEQLGETLEEIQRDIKTLLKGN